MGFKIDQGSSAIGAAIVWGSKDNTLPLPNILFFDGNNHLLPPDPDHQGEINPSRRFSLEGLIKEVSVRQAPGFIDRRDKTGEKNATRMSILIASTDGNDYRLVADLYDKKEDFFTSKSLQLLSSLGQLARQIVAEPEDRNHIYQLSFYRNVDKTGKHHSNSVIRKPIHYVASADDPELFEAKYDPKEFIRSPENTPPKGIEHKVGNKIVYDNTNVLAWMEEEIKVVSEVFGKVNAQQQHQAEDQSQGADIAQTLEADADAVSTEGLEQDLGAQYESPRG